MLAQDAIYQEDYKEYHAVALRYRTELAVSMVLLAEPLKLAQKALADSATLLAEQRDLNPPVDLTAALETAATEVDRLRGQFAAFAQRWRTWVEDVQKMDVAADAVEPAVVELVGRQNEATGAAQELAAQAMRFVTDNGTRVDALAAEGEGSTREVVVAAVLRGDHATVKAELEVFHAAAAKTALSGNVELDTHDRQLRGLRTRLAQRRDLVKGQLQLGADRAAHDRHAAQLDEARQEVRQLEQRREELVTELLATLQGAQELDAAVRAHKDLAGRLERWGAEITQLEARITGLDQKLIAARRRGPHPDRIEVSEPAVAPLPQKRMRDAALAGNAGGNRNHPALRGDDHSVSAADHDSTRTQQ